MNATTNTPGAEDGKPRTTAKEWLRSWLAAADEAIKRTSAGRSAREELEADRSRLERG